MAATRAPGRGAITAAVTRGDPLFISLLVAGYIHLLWLGFLGTPLWAASAIALVLAALIFRYV